MIYSYAGRIALLLGTILMVASASAQQPSPPADNNREPVFVALDDLRTIDPGGLQHSGDLQYSGDLRYPGENNDAFLDAPAVAGGCCDSDFWGWTVLPLGILYRAYLADVTASRMALHISHVADHVDEPGSMFDGTLGGRKGLIRYGNRNPFRPEGFQLDVEAAAHVRLSFEDSMDVQATDYRAGVPLTYGWGNKQIKFGYWHISSHIGDEYLLKHPNFDRLNYAKDSLVLGYSHYVTNEWRLYAETSWAFWSDIAKPWEFQFGTEYAPMCPTGIYGAPFAAFNVQLREELDFSGFFAAQTGWAWRGQAGGLLRLGLHYYNGKANQRSLYNQFERQIGVAMWYDY